MISTDLDRDLGVSEAIGFASFVGVSSIFAKHMYDSYSQIKKMRDSYKDVGGIIAQQLKDKKVSTFVQRNVAELGYNKLGNSSGFDNIVEITKDNIKMLRKQLDQKTYGKRTAHYVNKILDKVGGRFNVLYEGKTVKKIMTATDNPITIIDFAINNRITYGGKFNTHTAFVPGYFYDSSVVAGVLNNIYTRATIKSTLQNNYMTYNEAYLSDILSKIDNGRFHSNVDAIQKTAMDFAEYHLIPGYDSPGLAEIAHMNSMEFLYYDTKGLLTNWDIHKDITGDFGVKLNKLLEGQGNFPITFLKSQNAISSNSFLNPFTNDPTLKGFADRVVEAMKKSGSLNAHDINGQKKMFQAFAQPTEIIDADDFKTFVGAGQTQAIAGGGLDDFRKSTNATAVTEMQILDNDIYAEKLLFSGDYSGGVPLSIAQDEGYIADMSLLGKHNMMHENVRVSLGEGQHASMITENFTTAMEGFALHDKSAAGSFKSPELQQAVNDALANSKNEFEAARKIKSWLGDPNNAKYADEYNDTMVKTLFDMNKDRKFAEIIERKYNKQLSTAMVFGTDDSVVTLGKSVDGTSTIHVGNQSYISDIAFTGGEARLKVSHFGTLLESGGKSWSPAKDLLIGVMEGDSSAKQFLKDRMLIDRILKEDPNNAALAEQFASNPNKYRAQIHSQFQEHVNHIDPFVDQMADLKITRRGVRSLEAFDGQTSANFFQEMSDYIVQHTGADSYANGQFKDYFTHIQKDKQPAQSFGLRFGFHNSGTPTAHHYKDTPVAINSINVNRLRSNDYEDAAKYLERYYNWADYDALLQEAMPMLSPKRINKNMHVGLRLDKISEQSLGILFGTNGESVEQSRKHAELLAKELLGVEKVSDKTRYYIQINKELGLNMMLPLTDTNYTRELNQAHMEIEGRPMFKEWQSDIFSYINRVKSGKMSEAEIISHHRAILSKILSKLIAPSNFTKAVHENARSYRIVSDEVFSPSTIENLIKENPGNAQAIKNMLSSYGLKLDDMKNRPLVFMNSEDFEKAMNQAPKELYDKYFSGDALKAEYSKLQSANPNLSETELRAMTLKNQRRAIQADGLYSIISREPSYSAEGTDVAKVIEGPVFQEELYKAAGRKVNKSAIALQWAGEKSVRINDDAMQRIAGDLDEDTLKQVLIDDEATRLSTADLYKNKNPYSWRKMVGKKAGFRGFETNGSKISTTYLEATNVEKEYISKIYMNANMYGTSFHEPGLNIFQDGAVIKANEKRSLFNHFITTAPERAIGGKGIRFKTQAEDFLKIFNSNISTDERVKHLLSMGWAPSKDDVRARTELFNAISSEMRTKHGITDINSDAMSIFHLFEESELKAALEQGDTMMARYGDLFSKKTFSPNQIDQLLTVIKEHGNTGNETNVRMLASLLAGTEEKTAMQTAGDVISGAVKGLMKNKLALGIAGGAIAASYLLRPSSTEIKNQDTREESRRKGIIPKGADAIDPPMASVYKPHSRGMQYNVSGPISGSQSPEALYQTNFGMPVQNSYIDRSATADLDYIKRLQQEDKYNDWNRR